MSDGSVFGAYSRFYNLLYKDKNYEEESEYIYKRLVSSFRGVKSVLELGSGTGKHARLLANRGLLITGIERSEEMLIQARELSRIPPQFDMVHGDIRSTHVGRQYEAAISLFHVISYLDRNEDVVAAFQNAAHHLMPGGIFFFDVWYTPAVLFQRPAVRIKRLEDSQIRALRIAEPRLLSNDNLVEVNYQIFVQDKQSASMQVLQEQHLMRHFSIPEIKLFAAQSGFKMEFAEEFLTEKTPGEDTWGVAFMLRKTN